MIYTDLEEANKKIEELENIIKSKIHTRVIEKDTIICSVKFQNLPMTFNKFKKVEEPTSITDYYTLIEGCKAKGITPIISPNKKMMAIPFEMMDLLNDYGAVKQDISNPALSAYFDGVQPRMGGDDFTQTGEHLVWILSYTMRNEFMKVNPNWQNNEFN